MKLINTVFILLLSAYYLIGQVKDRPNFIIILLDDLGYNDVGFNGCKDIPTPGIDKIAANGVKFTSGYVSYAVCGPSRAGLITGKYQDRFGFSKNPLSAPNDPNMGLPLEEETIADYVKKANYKTGLIGKWHLGSHTSLVPNNRGFDEFYGFLGGGHQYFPELLTLEDEHESKSQYDNYKTKLLRNKTRVVEKEYLTDAFSREAKSFIQSHHKDPFFLFLSYNAPHTPLQATEKYLSRFDHIEDSKRRTYAAMVSAVDDGVNEILKLLTDLKIEDNTIVFFLSDNGGPLSDNASNNAPLRGKKGDFFEGGIRVPFAIQWKNTLPSGIIYDKPIISLDIFGTIAGILKIKTKNELDGVNLIPFIQNTSLKAPHESLFWRNYVAGRTAIRTVDHKLINEKDKIHLFDINTDMSEKVNLSENKKQETKSLLNSIEVWKTQLIEPKFMGLGEDKEYNLLHPNRFSKIK
jgi:arylsulfatase A-like enzyme